MRRRNKPIRGQEVIEGILKKEESPMTKMTLKKLTSFLLIVAMMEQDRFVEYHKEINGDKFVVSDNPFRYSGEYYDEETKPNGF